MASMMQREIMRNAQGGVPGGFASVLPNPFLYTMPRSLWAKAKDWFLYTANFVPLAASATQSVQTVINNDSAFLILGIVATCWDSPAETTQTLAPPQLVQISDQTSGRTFFDAATHWQNVFGTGPQPALCEIMRLVKPGSTITTTLTNQEATARVVRIAFRGFKVFDFDAEA